MLCNVEQANKIKGGNVKKETRPTAGSSGSGGYNM